MTWSMQTGSMCDHAHYGPTHYGSTHYGSTHYGSTYHGSTHYASTYYGSTHYGSTYYGDLADANPRAQPCKPMQPSITGAAARLSPALGYIFLAYISGAAPRLCACGGSSGLWLETLLRPRAHGSHTRAALDAPGEHCGSTHHGHAHYTPWLRYTYRGYTHCYTHCYTH